MQGQTAFRERQDQKSPITEDFVDELYGIDDWDGKKYSNNEEIEDYQFTVLDVRKYLSEQYQNGQEPHPEIQDKIEDKEYQWIERKLSEAEDLGLLSKETYELNTALSTSARPTFYSLER